MKITTAVKCSILAATLLASAVAFSAPSNGMFEPPNSQAKVLGKYFNGNRNFIFCFFSYDNISRKYQEGQFCIRKDVDQDRVFSTWTRTLLKVMRLKS